MFVLFVITFTGKRVLQVLMGEKKRKRRAKKSKEKSNYSGSRERAAGTRVQDGKAHYKGYGNA